MQDRKKWTQNPTHYSLGLSLSRTLSPSPNLISNLNTLFHPLLLLGLYTQLSLRPRLSCSLFDHLGLTPTHLDPHIFNPKTLLSQLSSNTLKKKKSSLPYISLTQGMEKQKPALSYSVVKKMTPNPSLPTSKTLVSNLVLALVFVAAQFLSLISV